ncbi:MAG: hypothetical protein ACXWAC_03485 [Usitatibacter sp.]
MRLKKPNRFAAAGLAIGASIVSIAACATPTISATSMPLYGQSVQIELRGADFPTYLPATRFKRSGSTIVIDYEYVTGEFAPPSPDFGNLAVTLGELAPGNYTVQARLFDINKPKSSPQTISANVPVIPPDDYGLYLIPMEPQAYSPAEVMVKSAVYFDPASMRATLSGNVIRVDFDYYGDAPVGSTAPAGSTSFASITMPSLQPGSYRVEGWGRAKSGGDSGRYFTKDFTVASTVPVVEFYSEGLDHYFLSATAEEIAMLDRGAQGDWKRTGQSFKAWARASDASPWAKPVCRFYAKGPNSHFFTGDDAECRYLKALEQQQRADAAAQGQPFLGWQYEGIAFYALMPEDGSCRPPWAAVYRSYNHRAAQGDSNHRFTIDPDLRAAMDVSWIDEGAAFCSPY